MGFLKLFVYVGQYWGDFLGYSKRWQIKQSALGLNGSLSSNFRWLRRANHVKFKEKSMMYTKKQVLVKIPFDKSACHNKLELKRQLKSRNTLTLFEEKVSGAAVS